MSRLAHKTANASRRANRARKFTIGTSERPRLSVHVSNMHITAQVIDDSKSKTLAYVTTVGQKQTGTMTEKAAWVGKEIATKAKKAKVSKVVFDRGARLFHGRVKILADTARENGLEF
jgi:large subunit ribosomal protein L18